MVIMICRKNVERLGDQELKKATFEWQVKFLSKMDPRTNV